MREQIWVIYKHVVEYAQRFCSTSCYDLLDDCREYVLDRVSRNDMKRLSSFRGDSSESTFAYIVVKNLIKDFLKTKKNVVSYDETKHMNLTHESHVMDSLAYDDLHDALKKIDLEDQFIIKLRYYDGYMIKEIAHLLNKTPKQISKKMENIKKKLREIIDA